MRATFNRRTLLIVMVVVVAGLFAVFLYRPKEPSYEGRSLTEWLRRAYDYNAMGRFAEGHDFQFIDNEWHAADHAIKCIGTNGIPTLLKLVQEKHSAIKTEIDSLLDHQSIIKKPDFLEQNGAQLAALGFEILGDESEPAFRPLLMLSATYNDERRYSADHCFSRIRSDRLIRFLLHEASGTNEVLRARARYILEDQALLETLDPEDAERLGVTNLPPDLSALLNKAASDN